jgi:hypothetical protein
VLQVVLYQYLLTLNKNMETTITITQSEKNIILWLLDNLSIKSTDPNGAVLASTSYGLKLKLDAAIVPMEVPPAPQESIPTDEVIDPPATDISVE